MYVGHISVFCGTSVIISPDILCSPPYIQTLATPHASIQTNCWIKANDKKAREKGKSGLYLPYLCRGRGRLRSRVRQKLSWQGLSLTTCRSCFFYLIFAGASIPNAMTQPSPSFPSPSLLPLFPPPFPSPIPLPPPFSRSPPCPLPLPPFPQK